jgi:hypothetical protein
VKERFAEEKLIFDDLRLKKRPGGKQGGCFSDESQHSANWFLHRPTQISKIHEAQEIE